MRAPDYHRQNPMQFGALLKDNEIVATNAKRKAARVVRLQIRHEVSMTEQWARRELVA